MWPCTILARKILRTLARIIQTLRDTSVLGLLAGLGEGRAGHTCFVYLVAASGGDASDIVVSSFHVSPVEMRMLKDSDVCRDLFLSFSYSCKKRKGKRCQPRMAVQPK